MQEIELRCELINVLYNQTVSEKSNYTNNGI